jgi:CRISPR-associated protein Csy1
MDEDVEGVQNSEPANIRELIEQYIQGRLNEKLEKLKVDGVAEREKQLEKYQVETWLEDASLRIGQLRLATHTPKQHHPDSKASAMFYNIAETTHHFVGSQGLKLDADVIGNAAVLDVFKLLRLKFQNVTLLDRLLNADADFIEALALKKDDAALRFQRFLAFSQLPTELNAGRLSKQVLFPVEQDDYHTLVLLYPSALVHRAYQQMSNELLEVIKTQYDAEFTVADIPERLS